MRVGVSGGVSEGSVDLLKCTWPRDGRRRVLMKTYNSKFTVLYSKPSLSHGGREAKWRCCEAVTGAEVGGPKANFAALIVFPWARCMPLSLWERKLWQDSLTGWFYCASTLCQTLVSSLRIYWGARQTKSLSS